MAASVGVTLIAWVLAYVKRLRPSPLNHSLIRLSTLGYALPGILLAVALLKPLGAVDGWLIRHGQACPRHCYQEAYSCFFMRMSVDS